MRSVFLASHFHGRRIIFLLNPIGFVEQGSFKVPISPVASDLVLVQLTPVFKQFVKQIRAFVAALVIAVSARRSPPRGSPSLSLPARTRLVFCFGFDRGLEGAEWAVSILTGAGAGTGPAAGGVQFQFSQIAHRFQFFMYVPPCPHSHVW